jgi:signal transduction histidine kinase
LSLEFCPSGSLIKITTSLKCLNEQKFFEIIIQDNGFALDEETISRMHEKSEGYTNGDDVNFALTAIKELIKMHDGTMQSESEWNNGKKITITFPYKKFEPEPEDLDKPGPSKTDNVYSFFKKESTCEISQSSSKGS